MKTSLLFVPLLFAHSAAYAQSQDDPSQFEIINNVVDEHEYTLPDAERARISDDSDLFNGQRASFYQDASNLNTGTLNNSRLASDLGNRIIANARHADRADRATRADHADRATRADVADFATMAGSATSANSATSADFALHAGNADNADLFRNRSDSYYLNATNLNSGTLNNDRLNTDLGNRTIENARIADFADEADITSGRVSRIGTSTSFTRASDKNDMPLRNGTSTDSYPIPSNATKLLVEARCLTEDNDWDGQTARIEVRFNGPSSTNYITLCEAGDNADSSDTDTSAGATQFDIPSGATQVTVRQRTFGGDDPSITSGTLYWFG